MGRIKDQAYSESNHWPLADLQNLRSILRAAEAPPGKALWRRDRHPPLLPVTFTAPCALVSGLDHLTELPLRVPAASYNVRSAARMASKSPGLSGDCARIWLNGAAAKGVARPPAKAKTTADRKTGGFNITSSPQQKRRRRNTAVQLRLPQAFASVHAPRTGQAKGFRKIFETVSSYQRARPGGHSDPWSYPSFPPGWRQSSPPTASWWKYWNPRPRGFQPSS